MSIFIKKSGFLTTIQDLGRSGFQRFGINPNGVMDQTATRLINILLGNYENSAVIEMHFPAPEILFEVQTRFSLGGADFGATLNDKTIQNWRIYIADKGDILQFTHKNKGARIYLAIEGGFQIKNWLDSSSTNLTAKIGGFEGRVIIKNDRININRSATSKINRPNCKISNTLIPYYSKFPTVRIIPNAEFDRLTPFSQEEFLKETFTITPDSNRMGFRLSGNPLYLLDETELISSAVNFGTIQLLPDGQLIVLMADHQTTGGYPRLATVIPNDLPLLAQLGANDKVGFHLIDLEAAENIAMQFENDLNLLKIGVKFL